MVIVIYCVLPIVTALYAFVLERNRRLWDSDLTWLAVVIGTAICLLAPFLAARWDAAPSWEVYEARVWRAFVVGSIPIILWQLGRSTRAWRAVENQLRRGADGQSDTETLAAQQRSGAIDDD